MSDSTHLRRAVQAAGFAAAIALSALTLSACSHASQPARTETSALRSAATLSAPVTESARSGAELWAQTCIRCHNLRSPKTLSDAQWEVAMAHMRVRANLTGEEQRKILAFLKQAN